MDRTPAVRRRLVQRLLPGGNNTNAFNLNDQGEVVGFAENGTADSTCVTGGTPSQVTQFEAVRWLPEGSIQELPPLQGDTVGFAIGINDLGQVVGSSGLCSNTSIPPSPSGPHAVLWGRDGAAIDLGNLGGTNSVGDAINNREEVVWGASTKDGIIHGNDQGQIVGFAIDGTTFNSRALIWLDKVMMDLNTLIPAGSPGMPGSPLKLAAPVQPTLRCLSPFDKLRFGRHQSF